METLRQQEKLEKDEGDVVKHTVPTSCPLPTMASPPPSSSSSHKPNTHNVEDDSDSPPHPVDSPTDSSLCSDHSSISRLSSLRDDAPPANPSAERIPTSPYPPASVVSVKRSVRDGPLLAASVVAKVDSATFDCPAVEQWAEEAPTSNVTGGGGARGGSAGRRLRPDLSILRRARRESMMRRVQLVSRVFGCVFCLVALSVMAADKDQGWALDSFYRYKEFRLWSLKFNCMILN